MKKLIIVFALFVGTAILGSCNNMTVTTGDGSEKVEGNGKMTSAEREVGSFNRIEMEGVFNVILTQGSKEALKINAEENIIDLIETSVDGNVLKIKMKDNVSFKKMGKIDVRVTFKELSEVSSEGVG